MKGLFFVAAMAMFFSGWSQTSRNEKTGLWTTSASWVGGIVPGTLASGTITATSKVVVVDGTIQTPYNVTFNLSNVTVNDGDTLVVLGNVNVTGSSVTNNGVLIVFGNFSNALSNSYVSGSGKLVVTGDYTNAFGANTLTGPSYVYGSTPGFFPPVGDESDLQTNDPALYNYTNNIYGVLPVELISFEAKVVNREVEISWATASEFNNQYFVVERSTNGVDFSELMKISGAGTSNEGRQYRVVDDYPTIGISYYRLTQVDYDRNLETFKVISVSFDEPAKLHAYPNPTADYVLVDVDPTNYDVSLRNSNGLMVSGNFSQQEFNGRLRLNLESLQSGVYVLQLVNHESLVRSQFRVIKQ
ncbi:MAG: T9SS type A sorting domain-containing protein [Cyclobacteriaceae bacterium]|nr:T9SS type A sorting domain-containing protein [Cyclobacteriaceae bacterium]